MLQGSPLLGAAFAIRHPGAEHIALLAILAVANICLVAHIFLINDWSNLTSDLADPNKCARVFTARGVGRTEIGALAIGLLGLSLILFGLLSPLAPNASPGPIPITLLFALAIASLSALYSLSPFNWKARPVFNSATHLAGGALHFLLGYTVWSGIDRRGLAIAMFFAVTFAAGHLTQEIRDHDGDVRNAIATNAATFGPRRTFYASLGLFTLAYAVVVMLALEGTLPRRLIALAVLYPLQVGWSFEALREGLTFTSIHHLQTRYRTLFAIIGVVMLIALWLD